MSLIQTPVPFGLLQMALLLQPRNNTESKRGLTCGARSRWRELDTEHGHTEGLCLTAWEGKGFLSERVKENVKGKGRDPQKASS